MKYFVKVAYDGNNYYGFQYQAGFKTIQEEIEKSIKKIFHEDIKILYASRTDAKVSALGQVFTFISEKRTDLYKLKASFNGLLPKDITVIDIKEVSDDFNCRYMVKSKTYRYYINNQYFNPILINKVYQCPYKLDLDLINQCLELFKGSHDFSSFNTSTYLEKPNQQRTINYFKLTSENNLLVFEINGDGFLRNMIRIIIGSIIDVARGNKDISLIKEMLDKPNKNYYQNNIEANGLYLMEIFY